MLHHISLGVRDLARAGAFYGAALGALGFRRVFDADYAIGYGLVDGQDKLLLNKHPDATPLVTLFSLLASGKNANPDAARQCLALLAARVQTGELAGDKLRLLRAHVG